MRWTDATAPLSCAGLTAYGAVRNANLKPDDNAVIVGTGGLGLMAIQLVKRYRSQYNCIRFR